MASPFGQPEKPPCDCRLCLRSFRTLEQQKQPDFRYSRSLSDAEARKTVEDSLMSLVNNWKWLHKQVDLNGELIEERWNKKTRLKRFLALKTAMGDYVLPRDLTLWRDNPFPAPDEEPARYRKALLLNYLTMNRLTIEPERFLGLLHSRAYFDPMAFAVCDNQRLEWVWKSGLLKTDYSKLMFNINRPSPQYCKLVDWQKDSCKWRLAIGFPRATLLLEAQQTILAFLKNTVNDLLNAGLPDIDHREPFIRSVGGFKYNSQEEHWCPYLNQPFTEPRVAREPEMADIARARHLVVADHLYILQTDSNYLLRMIFQISAALGHERERDDILRQTVAEISYDIWNYWSWELISRACRAVLHQQIKFGTRKSNKSKAVWVLRYQAAIHELSVLLNEQLEDRASYIPLYPGTTTTKQLLTFQSPRLLSTRANFSRYFTRTKKDKVVLDEQTLEAARKDDLFPLLWDICKIARSRNPTEVELDTAFALLEDRTRWMNIERDRIDERLYSCLSDLAAVHDFKSRMEVQRPALDRSVARKFLNSPDVQTSGYQIILNRHARKIRDAEFKNFDPPTADAPSKGLLRFVKAVGLHELQNGHDRVPAAKNLFWLTMRSQRHWLFEKAMREGRTPWTKEDIDADLRTISVRGTPRIRPTQLDKLLARVGLPEHGIKPFVYPPEISFLSTTPKKSSPPSTGLVKATILGPPDSAKVPAKVRTTLKEVITPVKDAWASIFELAAMSPEEAAAQQRTVDWKIFVTFMDDIGFYARTSAFDCIFRPHFAKRVFVGKGQGNNVGRWKYGGTIDFRTPLPSGKIDACLVRVMLGRLGTLLGDNGIRMRLRRITKVKNSEGMRIRRMEATAPPIVDDFEGEEDEEDDEEEEDFEEEYDGDEALEINDEAAGNGDELVEDVILEMSGEAKIAPEAAVPESPEPEADFTALQAQLQAEVEEAETKTAQETQAAESTDKKTSGNKRRSSSDDHEAENIEQLVGKVIGMGLRQRPRSSTRNSQRAVQKEGQQVDATAEEEVTVDLILPYNLRPRKKKRLD